MTMAMAMVRSLRYLCDDDEAYGMGYRALP